MRFCEAKAKPYGEKALRSWIKWIDDATDGEGNFLNGLENVAVKRHHSIFFVATLQEEYDLPR